MGKPLALHGPPKVVLDLARALALPGLPGRRRAAAGRVGMVGLVASDDATAFLTTGSHPPDILTCRDAGVRTCQ